MHAPDRRRILVTSALPYAAGAKHLGNLAGSMLPADVYARFMRARGFETLYICATDEHGTPAELAAADAGKIYRHIEARKGASGFIAEVSMDETDSPQTPAELLIILAALADEGVRLQTIAPKFTGRFNKGVDYVGDLAQFEREFNDDLAVIAHAVLWTLSFRFAGRP